MSRGKAPSLFIEYPLMTLRVSHDSGQTWQLERSVYATDDLDPLGVAAWPPCTCPRCIKGDRP